MSFLPDNYELPSQSGQYMELLEGDNRIRILTQPVMGWEDWQNRKPIRFKIDQKPLKPIDPQKPIRYFWAFVVYNYCDQRIQILNIKQATIQKAIKSLFTDKDWGDPYLYDIKINRSGKGKDTQYAINPVPHKPVEKFIIDLFNDSPCNLDALYVNEDPFAPHETHTPLGIDAKRAENMAKHEAVITQDQAYGLTELLKTCKPDYVKSLWKTLNEQKFNSISELPAKLYDRVKIAIQNNQVIKSENDIDALFPITSMDELAARGM